MDGLDLDVAANEIVGPIGANGAGMPLREDALPNVPDEELVAAARVAAAV